MHVNRYLVIQALVIIIGTSTNLARIYAVIKAKLMLYKPLFIVHVVKDLLKSYTVVRKQSTSITKVGVAHAYESYNNAGFKVSMQIN